jgi:hypothetical protein
MIAHAIPANSVSDAAILQTKDAPLSVIAVYKKI